MLEHGGRLRRASRAYGVPMDAWLDLSTGISPFAWPVPPVPASAWHRLPEDDDGLMVAAQVYYGQSSLLPVHGSQAAIQALPMLRAPSRVGVLAPGYAEHAQAWQRAGHAVERRDAASLFADAARYDVVILIHPNNPGGERFERDALLALHERLSRRGGWLIVDEAFIDATPERSLCALASRPGLVVLRSIGKFFGLAGARVGFVGAEPSLLTALDERLGPWSLSGPARHVATLALGDATWQAAQRARLRSASERLAAMLARHGLAPDAGCAFFHWVRHGRAAALYRALAERGVLVRLFEHPASLRFGLPGDEAAFARLDAALAHGQAVLHSAETTP